MIFDKISSSDFVDILKFCLQNQESFRNPSITKLFLEAKMIFLSLLHIPFYLFILIVKHIYVTTRHCRHTHQ